MSLKRNIVGILFTKTPQCKEAKTRLRQGLPSADLFVQQLHEAFIKDTCNVLADSTLSSCHVFWYPNMPTQDLVLLGGPDFYEAAQEGDSLSERIRNGLNCVWQQTSPAGIILIGSDCPTLDTPLLNQAVQLVSSGKVVVGPSQGGFYLLGLPSTAAQVPLKDSIYHGDQVANLLHLYRDFSPCTLDFREDIDTAHDLQNLYKHMLPKTGTNVQRLLSQPSSMHLSGINNVLCDDRTASKMQ